MTHHTTWIPAGQLHFSTKLEAGHRSSAASDHVLARCSHCLHGLVDIQIYLSKGHLLLLFYSSLFLSRDQLQMLPHDTLVLFHVNGERRYRLRPGENRQSRGWTIQKGTLCTWFDLLEYRSTAGVIEAADTLFLSGRRPVREATASSFEALLSFITKSLGNPCWLQVAHTTKL